MRGPLDRWKENPFYVLRLDPRATDLEAERTGRKILAQLELGLASARVVEIPLGPLARTPEVVRQSLAGLRDPRRRATFAVWAALPAAPAAAAPHEVPQAPWPEAMAAVGWRGLGGGPNR